MKILSKNKIIVSALALCIGASLAGSVSGTIAWYQYSTRANVSFIGKAGGFSGNLQMRFAGENDSKWRTRITWQEMNDQLASQLESGQQMEIVPMTFGALDKDGNLPADGYVQPLVGESKMNKWVKADSKKNYAQFTLQLRYNERDGINEGDPATDAKNVEENVYLSKVVIQQDAGDSADKGDLTDAIRVHISSSYGGTTINKLLSSHGKPVATKGELDIDGDGKNDKIYPDNDEFGFKHEDDDLIPVIYGDDGLDNTEDVQRSYKAGITDDVPGVKYTQEEIDAATSPSDPAYGKTTNDYKVEPIYSALVYSKNNHLYQDSTEEYNPDNTKLIGKTVAGDSGYLTVKVTIWVEGWQTFGNPESAIWDAKYIGSSFNVGLQFAVQDKLA